MTSKETMMQNGEAISADLTLADAADAMAKRDIGVLSVHDGERLVGEITDRDINARVFIAGRDPRTTRIGELLEIR